MKSKSINKIQQEAIADGSIDLLGSSKAEFTPAEMSNTAKVLEQLAANYSIMLANRLDSKNAVSSGELSESIQPLSLQVNGSVYSVEIVAKNYASFIDEGVDGWAKSRGSRFKFKTKGVGKEMLSSVYKYIEREGKMNQLPKKYAVVKKESKDWKVTNAKSVAYMIKRMGIQGNHFWSEATADFEKYLETELGYAVKVDIINNIVK